MAESIAVYTDELGKWLWEDGKLLEARRQPCEEEGFLIPIYISTNDIVNEVSESIIDVKKVLIRPHRLIK